MTDADQAQTLPEPKTPAPKILYADTIRAPENPRELSTPVERMGAQVRVLRGYVSFEVPPEGVLLRICDLHAYMTLLPESVIRIAAKGAVELQTLIGETVLGAGRLTRAGDMDLSVIGKVDSLKELLHEPWRRAGHSSPPRHPSPLDLLVKASAPVMVEGLVDLRYLQR